MQKDKGIAAASKVHSIPVGELPDLNSMRDEVVNTLKYASFDCGNDLLIWHCELNSVFDSSYRVTRWQVVFWYSKDGEERPSFWEPRCDVLKLSHLCQT